jgi:hypothetical protein
VFQQSNKFEGNMHEFIGHSHQVSTHPKGNDEGIPEKALLLAHWWLWKLWGGFEHIWGG